MTLLITVIGRDYALACSDLRTTSQTRHVTSIIDEKFNKHIVFAYGELNGNVSFTGVAQWSVRGKSIKLYDVIGEALVEAAAQNLSLSLLTLNLFQHIQSTLRKSGVARKHWTFELHILARHHRIPYPTLIILSTYRSDPPWPRSDVEPVYDWDFGSFHVHLKTFINETAVVFGGTDSAVAESDRQRAELAVRRGANAFDAARLSDSIIRRASLKTRVIGRRSVSIVLPSDGYVDTNYWDQQQDALLGYIPKMVFSNGEALEPSILPINVHLFTKATFPANSLFFKSIVAARYKRSLRRRIFRRRSNLLVPSLMAMIGLVLFGSVQPGYTDFGLGPSDEF